MGAESGMNSSVRDDRVALSDGAKALWGKTNRIDDSEWLPLYVHMVDSAAMASKIWDTWVPQGTKAVIVGDLGNDEVLARKLMIFMAGIHDIGKATPVFQAKSITFGPEAGSFAWKAERAGLPMIAGLRGTNHPTHPIAGEIILEGYLLRVRGWERKAARQYACVVGGHHGTPPDKSKIDEEKNRKTNVGLDSEAWVSTQDELIDFVANIEGPKFSRGADSVYDAAALMESLAVLDLTAAGASCAQQLPQDIARTVRSAYGNDPHGFLPHMWLPQYDDACEKRDLKRVQKQQKAGTYLLQSVGSMNQRRSLVNWFLPQVDEVNEDEGQRAVRDTQDTVEVLLLRKCDDGIHLLPWVGDEHADVEKGSIVPTTVIPDDTVAKIAVQCAVRLPMGLCMPDRVDALIASLEEACADDVACWQDSPWLAGKLALFLHGDADGFVSDELCGYEIRYSRDTGLTYSRKEDNDIWHAKQCIRNGN